MGARWLPCPLKTSRKKRTNSFLFLDDRPKAQVCIFGWDGFPPVVNLTIPGSNGYARISFQNFEVVAYSLANIANCAELGASLSAPRTIDERAEALTRCTSTWQSCTRQMRAASKFERHPKCLAEMGVMLDLNFVLCCDPLKHFIACFQFGVGSISKDTLTEQPSGRAGAERPKDDVALKILNLRTFERVEVKAV